MPQHIRNGKPDDCSILAEIAVCEVTPQERQSVTGHLEPEIDRSAGRIRKVQCRRQIQGQNGSHSIEGTAFGKLAPKKVFECNGVPLIGFLQGIDSGRRR